MIIQQPNPQTSSLPKTYLSTSIGTATSIPVKNINSFQLSWGIQIGETGEEQSEVQMLAGTAPAGTALAIIGTTSYSHPADTPVYPIKFNQVIFKVSTTGTAGTVAAITNGTVGLQVDNAFTQFDHTSGAATYAYKTAFYNSVLDVSSDDSSWILPAGNSQYSLYRIRQRIRDKLFNSAFVTDDTLNDWINEWKDELTNAAIKVNKDYAIGTTSIAFSANQELGTITPADFKNIRRMWFVGGDGTYPMIQIQSTEYRPDEVFGEYHPVWYYRGDSVVGRMPTTNGGTADILYSKLNTNLVNDSDELPSPMRGYTKSFVDYCNAQAYYKDNNKTEGDRFSEKADIGKLEFTREITPRHESGPEFITAVDPVNEDESYYYF